MENVREMKFIISSSAIVVFLANMKERASPTPASIHIESNYSGFFIHILIIHNGAGRPNFFFSAFGFALFFTVWKSLN